MAELTARGHDAVAVPGGRGQFDVVVDGRPVFSKHDRDRFPEDGEVAGLLAG